MLSDANCGDSPNIYRRGHVTTMGVGVGMRSGHVVIDYVGSIIVLRHSYGSREIAIMWTITRILQTTRGRANGQNWMQYV